MELRGEAQQIPPPEIRRSRISGIISVSLYLYLYDTIKSDDLSMADHGLRQQDKQKYSVKTRQNVNFSI